MSAFIIPCFCNIFFIHKQPYSSMYILVNSYYKNSSKAVNKSLMCEAAGNIMVRTTSTSQFLATELTVSCPILSFCNMGYWPTVTFDDLPVYSVCSYRVQDPPVTITLDTLLSNS